jgi:hypothetical protein
MQLLTLFPHKLAFLLHIKKIIFIAPVRSLYQ